MKHKNMIRAEVDAGLALVVGAGGGDHLAGAHAVGWRAAQLDCRAIGV